MKIAVLGGGVVGVTSAYYLARAGHEVCVLERHPEAGLEASFANAGLITAGHAEAWAGPGVPWKVVRGIGRADAPVLFHPRLDPRMWAWCLRFLRNCTADGMRRHSARNIRLARYSMEALRELRGETSLAYDGREDGLLMVTRSPKVLDGWLGAMRLAREEGVAGDLLDGPGCERVEPALRFARERVCGGIFTPGDESGDCFRFTQRLAEVCRAMGVDFRYGVEIEGLSAAGGRVEGVRTASMERKEAVIADHYVLAAGSFSPILGRSLGLRLPIHPIKGYSVTFPTDGSERIPKVSLSDLDHKLGVSRLGERLRVAGTAEFAGYDTRLSPVRSRSVLKAALELVPQGLDTERAEFWCGLRPATPDGPPILGATRFPNLTLNTGHGTMGWTMACGSGRIVADLISGREPEIDLDGLTYARFSTR